MCVYEFIFMKRYGDLDVKGAFQCVYFKGGSIYVLYDSHNRILYIVYVETKLSDINFKFFFDVCFLKAF